LYLVVYDNILLNECDDDDDDDNDDDKYFWVSGRCSSVVELLSLTGELSLACT